VCARAHVCVGGCVCVNVYVYVWFACVRACKYICVCCVRVFSLRVSLFLTV